MDECATYLPIESKGTAFSVKMTFFSRSASADDAGNSQYTLFVNLQHCSMKLTLQ